MQVEPEAGSEEAEAGIEVAEADSEAAEAETEAGLEAAEAETEAGLEEAEAEEVGSEGGQLISQPEKEILTGSQDKKLNYDNNYIIKFIYIHSNISNTAINI